MNFCRHPTQYDRDELGNEMYPKKRNGSEYYIHDQNGMPVFVTDQNGKQRYAHDAEGNEIYPKNNKFLYHSQWKYPIYTRDKYGNETYPRFKGREIFAQLSDGEMLPALYASGRQRYPIDRYGNQYMPICKITKKPYYLSDEKGYKYRPFTVNGFPIYISSEEAEEEDCVYEKRDALNSKIYTADHKMKRESLWTHMKESCIIGGCCLFIIMDLCAKSFN